MIGGTVGPTFCYQFLATDVQWMSADRVELRPRGKVTICGSATCPPSVRRFSDVVTIEPRTAGWLRIEVVSGCASLVDSIAVRAPS
jgi:hypothetical protein